MEEPKIQDKKKEAPLVQPEDYGKREIIMFIGYFFLLIVVLNQQLSPGTSQLFRSNLKKLLLTPEIIDATPLTLERQQILNWIESQLLVRYYEDIGDSSFALQKDITKMTGLRILTQRALVDGENNIKIPLEQDRRSYGNENQFIYHSENEGFQVFFNPYFTNSSDAKIQLNNFIKQDFFNRFVNVIQVDTAYYIANLDITSYISISFNLYPSGLVDHSIKTLSIRYNQYQTIEDNIRQILEFVIIGFYCYYSANEIFKFKNQIDKQQKADDKKIAKEKKQEAAILAENERVEKERNPHYKAPEVSDIDKKKMELKEFANKQRRRVINIANGAKNHIQDLWSLFDVLTILFLGLAIYEWFSFATNNDFQDKIKQINYKLMNKEELHLDSIDIQNIKQGFNIFEQLNQMLYKNAIQIAMYSQYASVSLFIMSYKVVKYTISFSEKLKDYMQIIIIIIDYMLFYLILLVSLLIAFSMLINLLYGYQIHEFSSFSRSLVQIIVMIKDSDLVADTMCQMSLTTTFIIYLFFYLIIVTIMTNNYFFVQIKNELVKYEEIRNKIKDNVIVKTDTHFLIHIKDKLIMIYKKFRPPNFEQIEKEFQKKRNFEREFKNSNEVNYDVNFQDQIDNQSMYNQSGYMVEKDIVLMVKKSKISLVKLIWSTVMLIFVLGLQCFMLVSYYEPERQFANYQVINKSIQQGNFIDKSTLQSYNMKTIFDRSELFSWFQLMVDDVFQKKKIVLDYNPETNPTIQEYFQHLEKNTQGHYMLDGYTLKLFNVLAYDTIRFTVRRSQQENSTAEWSNIQSIKSSYFFNCESDGGPKEFTEDIEGQYTGQIFAYNETGGFLGKGGYVFYSTPENMSQLITNLYLEGVLNGAVNTMAVDFVLINFMEKTQFIYVNLLFSFNEGGFLNENKIVVNTVTIFSIQTFRDVFFLIIISYLGVINVKYVTSLFRIIYSRFKAYDSWVEQYINSSLTEAQLYYRERKNPEIIRKALFIIGVPQILQGIFVTLLTIQMIFLQNLFYQSLRLYGKSIVFDVPLQALVATDDLTKLLVGNPKDFDDYLTSMTFATDLMILIKPVSAGTIIIMCVELIFNLTHNKGFQQLYQALKLIIAEVPLLLFLLYGFQFSFLVQTHYTLGFQFQSFSTLYGGVVLLTEYLYSISVSDIFEGSNVFSIFIFLIPYMILIRFIIITLFYAITYTVQVKVRQEFQKNKQAQIENGFSPKDFVIISIELFQQSFNKNQNVKDLQFLVYQIKNIKADHLFTQIQNTFKQLSFSIPIDRWADRCAEDIKEEIDIKNQLRNINNEITSTYFQQINDGKFEYFSELNADIPRKHHEFVIKLKYWMFFHRFHQFYDKILIFFSKQINKQDEIINQDLITDMLIENDYFLNLYMEKLEKTLEESYLNLQILNNKIAQQNIQIKKATPTDSQIDFSPMRSLQGKSPVKRSLDHSPINRSQESQKSKESHKSPKPPKIQKISSSRGSVQSSNN